MNTYPNQDCAGWFGAIVANNPHDLTHFTLADRLPFYLRNPIALRGRDGRPDSNPYDRDHPATFDHQLANPY